MIVLQVIHGYPMLYNAGSEVYTQTLCHALTQRHEVHVFTREENPIKPSFAMREEGDDSDPRIRLHIINTPNSRDRYRYEAVDERFAELLDRLHPDIVHVGHLNHLSTSVIIEAASREIPIIYTLHDYWLMCPRGQFIQMYPEQANSLWAACDMQEDRKCAERCYARYFSGGPGEYDEDVTYWASWINRRMKHIRNIVELIDLFIAPSQFLLCRYKHEFGLPGQKLLYLDYGFDKQRLKGRKRVAGEPLTFGYIGSHKPAKGIHDLLRAFQMVRGNVRLRIWGRPNRDYTSALKSITDSFSEETHDRVEWLPEYRNRSIVNDVFNWVDVLVVPSIWDENSPLVIHEALQLRIPVITADAGGMREYVNHKVNGLLFHPRDPVSLAKQMQRIADDSSLARRLGQHGYLQSETGDIDDILDHVTRIEHIYEKMITGRNDARVSRASCPWRITFDTNPHDCNLKCIMCETFSEYSPRRRERLEAKSHGLQMPISLIRHILEDVHRRGLQEIIPSTIGEPLLYDQFDDILQMCVEFGVKLNLTTNGTFPGNGALEWAKRIVPIASDVKISWNGATKYTQERIMVGSHWDKMLDNVGTFIEVRDAHALRGGNYCRVTLQMTFLEWNVHELADIIRLAAHVGVDRVKGHHIWAHFEELKPLSMLRSPESINRWNQAVFEARAEAKKFRLSNGQEVVLDNIYPLSTEAVEDKSDGTRCPFLGQEAWINSHGKFDPCCAPDEQRKSLGDFGNVNEMSIQEIWLGDAYQRLLKTYRNRTLCRGCNMRKPVAAL